MLYKELEDQDALLVKSVEIVEQKPASTPPHAQPANYKHLTPNSDLTPKKDTSAIQADPAKRKHHMTEPESPPRSSKVSRFRVPGQTPAPTPAAATESISTQVANHRSRNPFLLRPPHSGAAGRDPEGFTPLPEHFSPHRRSQKFVPGGMADTVRTWILNVGEGGSHSQLASTLSSQRMERWQPSAQPLRLHVTECVESRPGDRLRLISGNTISSPAIKPREGNSSTRAILVGPAKGSLSSIKAGDELAIAPPSWYVEIGEHSDKWLVAVNWSSN
ncbi:hypothetical protein MPH_10461 [Macrophomina phaseolina MS6]|uniref:Uncharacterized protein n=2 Tax=Macrophomina phaseolina TaxID=35725 RepID=K2RQ49_MACPH|nr:hypothetical protein MPH_10461 [Macrophomina phaseolina MS6]KAH7056015.1 hypothetical protein B0J12DRAFT_439852 [Macrophomina phaseolina]